MQHFQWIMLYYFKKDKNATETQKRFVQCMKKVFVTDGMCQKWFAKFLGTF